VKDTGFMWVDEFCKQPSETSSQLSRKRLFSGLVWR
jgi:hypothetical protein